MTRFLRPPTLRGTDPIHIVDLKQIRQIVELMNEHGLSYFHLEKKDFNIKLKKGADAEALAELLRAMPGPAAAVAPAALAAQGDPAREAKLQMYQQRALSGTPLFEEDLPPQARSRKRRRITKRR